MSLGAIALLLCTSPDPGWVPSVALRLESFEERLSVAGHAETRSLAGAGLDLGLEYLVLPGALEIGQLEGTTALGLSLVFAKGSWPVHLEQELRWVYPPADWLALFGGLSLGISVSFAEPEHSFIAVGAVLGARIGPVELGFTPRLSLPIGPRETETFGGLRVDSAALGLSPLGLRLRWRIEALGFGGDAPPG